MVQSVSALAVLLAGPLADRVLEPAMMPGGGLAQLFNHSFGTGNGSGMALLYVFCALTMMFVGIGGYFVPQLNTIEAGQTHQLRQ